MNKILIIVIFGLLLSACKPTEKDFINIGESLVRNNLNDPDSAKFDSFYHSSDEIFTPIDRPSGELDGYVCGRVNAKNAYGGYTGKKPYYVHIETKNGKLKKHGPVIIVSDGDQENLFNFKLICPSGIKSKAT
ncbi:hypothetical protein [Xenorhabdus sp. KK7.4]|uniref:hypothetical protein n=1 Tax=Xenorhabdus sp. KK7.4 TaxID=1851572 RepID=UPI000C067ABC|nr:hypothetical protein [Xenorhabdus sp. KK7.4]PHM51011.1 exported hypothetical protein [Xenorhabdus sp. KK7.4]